MKYYLAVVTFLGQENMSQAKHCAYIRGGQKLGELKFEDIILRDGLTDPTLDIHMGNTAEHLACHYSVSRTRQDEFALSSQSKAAAAIQNNYFSEEIIAVEDPINGNQIRTDEHIKPNTTMEKLAKLKPAFQKVNGTVTAGNASGLNDGAAAIVLCDGSYVKAKRLSPLAVIVACAQVGLEPIEMGLGPVGAIKAVLEKAKWSINDVDIFEINEAFAVQSVLVVDMLKIDSGKVNINGGAIALGHPIGASGARILVTLLYNMRRTMKNKGVAALCIGGGMGIAIAVQLE